MTYGDLLNFDNIRWLLGQFKSEIDKQTETLIEFGMVPRWKPIHTAPRDGTVILGYDGFRYFVMAFFEDKSGEFWAYGADGEITCNPKFWLPLPNPPGETVILDDDELARLRQERDELRERGEALAKAMSDIREGSAFPENDFQRAIKDRSQKALDHWRKPAKPERGYYPMLTCPRCRLNSIRYGGIGYRCTNCDWIGGEDEPKNTNANP